MATYQPVSAAELYRLTSGAAAARRKPDYYGIGATLGGLGTAYDDMNKSIRGANETQVSNAQTNARLDSGYYPAEVASQMAGFGKKTYDDTNHVTMGKAIEEGHRAAAALNLNAGSPQYQLFMNQFLTQHGPYKAAADSVKGAREASKTLQERGAAQSFVKQAVERRLAMNIAQERYNEKTANQSMSKEQKDAAAAEARNYAKNLMLQKDVKINISPDGEVSATDNDGETVPIEPRVVATALAMMGDNVPLKALDVLSADVRKELEQLNKNALAAKKIDAPEKAVKPMEDPMRKLQIERWKFLHGQESKYVGKENLTPDDIARRNKLGKQIEDLDMQLFGGGAITASKPYDPNALVSKASGPGMTPYGGPASDFIAPPNMLFGEETGMESGSEFLGSGDVYREGLIRYGA